MPSRPPAAVLLLPMLLAAACGSSSDDESADAAPSCSTSVEVTDVATGESTTLDHGGAVSLAGGAAYTLYAADVDLDMASVSAVSAPVVAEGSQLVTVAITVFGAVDTPDPVEVGDEIPAGSGSGERVFVVTRNVGSTTYGNGTGATGTATVRDAGAAVCVDVDYEDGEKSVSGTIAAEVKEL